MNPKLTKVPPLFYLSDVDRWSVLKRRIVEWLLHHKPDVLVCHSSLLLECAEKAGYRVPEDIGIVHLATDDEFSDWAGVSSNKREAGAMAVGLLISLVNNRQFGAPKIARDTLIRGAWHPGFWFVYPE